MGIYRTTGKTITDTVARNIARRMHDLNLTWDTLQTACNFHKSTLQRLVNGKGDDISIATAAQLCTILDTTWFALSHDPIPPTLITTPTIDNTPPPPILSTGKVVILPLGTHVRHFPDSPTAPIQILLDETPVVTISLQPRSSLSSGRRTPLSYYFRFGLKTWPWRSLLDKISRALRALFPPRSPRPDPLQLALDYTTIFHDGESEQEIPHVN